MSRKKPNPHEDICSLIVDQKIMIDGRDAEGVRDCWAAEATMTVQINDGEAKTVEGREAIMAATLSSWTSGMGLEMHFSGPVAVTPVAQDRAIARSACLFLIRGDGALQVRGYGRYEDEVIREGGRWKILHRRLKQTIA